MEKKRLALLIADVGEQLKLIENVYKKDFTRFLNQLK
jgi:hypothetical protein